MDLRSLLVRIRQFMSVPSDNPELLMAQFGAFQRQMPMMYFILVSSTWAVAATHLALAPVWMTVQFPILLTLGCGARVLHWWRSRNVVPTPEIAVRALSRTNRLASVFAVAFAGWSFMLFPYGDAYTKSHLAFYMAITVIACIFSLMHLRSAAITVAAIVNGAFVAFFVATGQPTFVATAINMLLVSLGMLVILLINYRDFTNMVNAQTEALRREKDQSRLLRMIDDMPVAVMTVDPETFKINYANETSKALIRSISHLIPVDADQLVGTSVDAFHRSPEHQRRILSDPKYLPHSTRIHLGPEVIDLKISSVTDNDGSYLGPMMSWALVTKEVEAERRIRQLALYDTLTGLANRHTLREQLESRLASPVHKVGLMFVDLDGFKLVNDTRGHRVGDVLLTQVASRLRSVCGGGADISIGRLGGDEFAILTPHDTAEEACALAARVISVLSDPFTLDHDRHIQIGASVGIALAPAHGDTAEILLAHADLALYAAKAAGKGTAKVFSADMESRMRERVRLEAKLRDALESREGLFVFYQPIVDIETRKVTAREALVRWHDDHRGWISPGEFVPVAEESGLIEPLGTFVLNRACREAATWEDGARVAVNVSAAQLGKGTLAPTVLSALLTSGLPADRLEIEVTETALLSDGADSIGDLRRLRDMGVRVALDDFGTGYSSLAHLRAFKFDKIKIDGSFVKDAVERPDCAAVVRAIADLGTRLGVTTVAEGVETEAQLERIREEGCREVQGYLLSRPMPSAADAAVVAELNRPKMRSSMA